MPLLKRFTKTNYEGLATLYFQQPKLKVKIAITNWNQHSNLWVRSHSFEAMKNVCDISHGFNLKWDKQLVRKQTLCLCATEKMAAILAFSRHLDSGEWAQNREQAREGEERKWKKGGNLLTASPRSLFFSWSLLFVLSPLSEHLKQATTSLDFAPQN